MSIRVLLVDDHTMFREALSALLAKASGIEVVGEASDGTEVEALADSLQPDVVVMDVSMPDLNGIEATRRLLARYPALRVIALSAFVYRRFVLDMLNAGAVGYLSKTAAGDDLVRAIRQASARKVFLCGESSTVLANAACGDETAAGQSTRNPLGRREREVLCLLAEGKSSAQIGALLHIAPSTAETHRRNLMRKLDLHNVAELTKYAIREGLVNP
ncbi:MAG TPA: response regulator transcription factor [Hydrogenophaga sp.]|uniref:response regulator transcription factor n=1 Tax=Hydrogenophaga sp. TaxID=1904254 RepID=UPI002C5BD99C|nr:response regulator transcription factor [Hydrogenophaga sp.]HMN93914.1 response regulator transcription factor [Hydrogenophaga sp.]HMP11961.1 response regulator transcription factor [Hydrogenophaga sp.]